MTLQSVFTGEGFGTQPAQFVDIVTNWVAQNRYLGWELSEIVKDLSHYSFTEQAQILIEWIDTNATVPMRDNCIQFIMDTTNPASIDEFAPVDDDSDLQYDNLGYPVS